MKSTPDGLHQYLAGKPPGNMGHRELSYKGKALVINGLLTSNLWYNVMSLLVPSWAIAQIEASIYKFFWNYQHHLVNKDILALPVQHGGFTKKQ